MHVMPTNEGDDGLPEDTFSGDVVRLTQRFYNAFYALTAAMLASEVVLNAAVLWGIDKALGIRLPVNQTQVPESLLGFSLLLSFWLLLMWFSRREAGPPDSFLTSTRTGLTLERNGAVIFRALWGDLISCMLTKKGLILSFADGSLVNTDDYPISAEAFGRMARYSGDGSPLSRYLSDRNRARRESERRKRLGGWILFAGILIVAWTYRELPPISSLRVRLLVIGMSFLVCFGAIVALQWSAKWPLFRLRNVKYE